MKRLLMWLVCLGSLFIFSGGDLFAQYSQTKCPPKKQSWKVRKTLIKFPELIEKEEEKERTARQKKAQKPAKEKEEKTAKIKQDRRPVFSFDKRRNARLQKVDNREVASTKCPR